MQKHLDILEALFKDVNGNLFMGNHKNAAGYLNSISLLTAAMSRQCQQKFELGVIEELEEMSTTAEIADGLKLKRKLNQRELELNTLDAELANYLATVSSGCFMNAADAAFSLRSIADSVEKQAGNELFPKPMTRDEMKAFAEEHGVEYVDSTNDSIADIIERLAGAAAATKPGMTNRAARRRTGRR